MHRLVVCGIIAVLSVTELQGCEDSATPAPVVTVRCTADALTIEMSHSEGRYRTIALNEGVGRVGLERTGEKYMVRVIAAKLPHQDAFDVTVDSTRELMVCGEITRSDGSQIRMSRSVPSGQHQFVLTSGE